MSKLGLSFVLKLLEEPSLDVLQQTGLSGDMFKGTDKKLFDKITMHFRTYGKMPEWETVLDAVEVDKETLPSKVKEPARYYADAIVNLVALNSQRDWMKKQAEALKNQDPVAFIDCSKGVLRDANERFHFGGGQLVDLTKNGAARLEEYEKLEGLTDSVIGIRSPYPILDEITQGWKPGDLITVVGRTGTGKTWDALLCADVAHQQGVNVGFISMEMPVNVISRRRDAIRFKLPYNDFKRGKLDAEAKERWRVGIIDQPPADEARWLCTGNDRIETVDDVELFVEQTGVKFLVIDGFYLLQDEKGKSDWDRVTRVIRRLRKLALKRLIAVLVTTQTTKGDKKKEGAQTVTLDDVAFADTINQESAIVKTLWQGPDEKARGEMAHRIRKNREGELLDFMSAWDFQTMDFQVLEGVSPEDDAVQDDKPEGGKKGKRKAKDEDIPF